MINSFSILINLIKNAWYNIKNAKSINQERYNFKRFKKIPKNEVQNKCKRSCACKKKKQTK